MEQFHLKDCGTFKKDISPGFLFFSNRNKILIFKILDKNNCFDLKIFKNLEIQTLQSNYNGIKL